MKKIALLILLIALVGVQGVHAGFSYEMDIASSYVWRGFDLFSKNVPAIQPSVTYTFGESGFSLNLWGCFVLTDRNTERQNEEIDITLNYDFQLSENLALSVGMINYGLYWVPHYTFKTANTQEIYATLGFPRVMLGPSFSVYFDINQGKGFYIEAAAGHSFEFSHNVKLDLSASLGYNSKLFIEESGISDLNIAAAFPFALGKCSITPSLNFTHVFLEELYRAEEKKEKIWVAINFGF
ncbi:MAG: hypothetical protein GY757_04465 [bacterium]|nr:hypothetical protein [bacterium]